MDRSKFLMGYPKKLHLYLIASGAILLLVAFFIDTLESQILVIGLILFLIGLLGQRIFFYYKLIAIILLNTLLLFVGIELAAGTALTIVDIPSIRGLIAKSTGQENDLVAHYQSLPYYAAQDWTSIYWQEHKTALKKTYSPYVVWRSPVYHGTALNIDQNGIRNTPGSECVPDAIQVFIFGGSSIWGWGAPDWRTIPAILQSELEDVYNEPVCVVNYGENAYVSAQSLVQLILLLESGSIPDIVVFYDGVNDVLSASQSGKPLVHQNLDEIAALFNNAKPGLVRFAENLNSYRLLQMVLSQVKPSMIRREPTPEYNSENLADQVAETYLNNLKIARSLANTYEFELYFFWQPHILIGNKPLSVEEQNMITGLDWVLDLNPDLVELFRSTYENVEFSASNNENLYYLGNIFDNAREPIWIDTWGHITPRGNDIVVEAIFGVIKSNEK